jgi:hypothetical protein
MADNLGTAAYKLVLDARDFQASAVQSGKSMRDVQQVMRETTTPAEKLAAKYDAVTEAYEKGLIPQKNYERYLAQLNETAEKAAAQVDAGTAAVNDNATATGKAASSTQGLSGSIEQAVLGYMSFNAILSKVGEALQWTREQTEAAMASAHGMTDANRRLIQVSDEYDPQDLDRMLQQADELAAKYGEDREVVREVIFSARSEGFDSAVDDIIKFGDIIDARAAATVAGQVPGLFGEGSIDPSVAVSATLAAAKSSRLDFERIAQAMPIIAAGGAMQGSDPAEAMGMLSVMASHTKSGDEAANLFKSLAVSMSLDERTKGKGLIGGFEAIQGMTPEEQTEFLGTNKELNIAFTLLGTRLEDVKARIALVNKEIEAGATGGESNLDRIYGTIYDPSTYSGTLNAAKETARREAIALEIANERQLAVTGLGQQSAIDTELRKMKEAGQSTFGQWAAAQFGGWAQAANLDPSIVRGVTMAGRAQFGGPSTDDASRDITNIGMGIMSLLPDLDAKAEEQQKTMQEIANNTKAMAEGPPMVRVQGAF